MSYNCFSASVITAVNYMLKLMSAAIRLHLTVSSCGSTSPMDHQSFCFDWEEAGVEQSFFFNGEHSEVADALSGFFDDSNLLPFDTIFQNDVDSLMVSSSSANGKEDLNPIFLPSPEIIQEQPPPLFQQTSFFCPSVNPTMAVAAKTDGGGSFCMSTQSVAARQRRKRISEKTQELGRLIPGGTRMNIAQMLQAAFKYVKFLQAQVAILDLMAFFPECKSAKEEDLQVLLASPAIQQRLSEEGMCRANGDGGWISSGD